MTVLSRSFMCLANIIYLGRYIHLSRSFMCCLVNIISFRKVYKRLISFIYVFRNIISLTRKVY